MSRVLNDSVGQYPAPGIRPEAVAQGQPVVHLAGQVALRHQCKAAGEAPDGRS